MKASHLRQSKQHSSSRQSGKNGQKKVFAVPLTEREMNYLHRNKSPDEHGVHARKMRKSSRLSSRENRMYDKSSGKRGLNSSIGRPFGERSGAYTERIGHRRTRTIGGASERRDWGGLAVVRDRTGSRTGGRSGRLTSRDGRSSTMYKGKY